MYFDTASTTQIAQEVLDEMVACLSSNGCHGNPSSLMHQPGRAAAAVVAAARKQMAAELGCEAGEILFTSGATEANNLAIQGVALAHAEQGRHLITSKIEHKSVLETCQALERQGFDVTYLTPNRAGWIELEDVKNALRTDTLLVSLMHTNNETGIQQPLEAVADLIANAGVLFHVDASQAAGKFRIDLNSIPIDLLSISAHKFHGPKGAGCLFIRNRRRLKIQPLVFGGGQEFGLRSGTLATHQIVGLSEAMHLAASRRDADFFHVVELKSFFLERLAMQIKIKIHGDPRCCSPYLVNISIAGISSDALINQLLNDVAISSGAACSSGTIDSSYVLRAMGIDGDDLYGAVRIGFSRYHTISDVLKAAQHIVSAVHRMQELD